MPDYTKRNVPRGQYRGGSAYRKYTYGRQFTKKINGKNRKVMYRYYQKRKDTKTLVYVSTKMPCK